MKQPRTTVLYSNERKLFFIAVSFVSAVCMLYVYFVCIAVVHVVARTATDRDIREISLRINTLEARFIEAKRSVTYEVAAEKGFVSTGDKIFVTRTPATLVLLTNDES